MIAKNLHSFPISLTIKILFCRGAAFSLSAIYLGLLYGLYVPDWQFEMSNTTSSVFPANHSYVYMVRSLKSSWLMSQFMI